MAEGRWQVIANRWHNMKAIWSNAHQDDAGIEKVIRLILASSNFVFPGMYLKQLYSGFSTRQQEYFTDAFVLAKLIFPFFICYFGWYENPFVFWILIWLMLETLMYVPTLIFASDIFKPPRSYRRSMLLVFINYFEIVLDFAVIYASIRGLNREFGHWYDPIYFSFSTSASLGLGDYYPETALGKMMVSFQSVIFFVYVVLFINVYSNRVEHKGYFSRDSSHHP